MRGWLPCQHLLHPPRSSAPSSHPRPDPSGAPTPINQRKSQNPSPPSRCSIRQLSPTNSSEPFSSRSLLLFWCFLPLSLDAFSPGLLLLTFSPILGNFPLAFSAKSSVRDRSSHTCPDPQNLSCISLLRDENGWKEKSEKIYGKPSAGGGKEKKRERKRERKK